ncbi:MAG: hypothetical protein ACD_10C00887G0001, partial [uncultured bacterium]
MGEQMRRRMPNNLETFSILVSNNRQFNIFFNAERGIDQPTINLTCQRSTRQTSANTGSNLSNRDRLLKGTNGTIRQLNIRHGGSLGKKKVRSEPH